ncbi:MAG TPA: 4Fe-4S dicluster domain-containing protein [Xanthomonadaceae bacterium]|nr:4Fe-4S dicluster domain-containing protein [Xanthomonadaceae bacterium]
MATATTSSDAEQPCIRCGDCATVCPVELHPQRLLVQLRDWHLRAAENDGAMNCTECGRCDAVCPSRIPLLQRYREAKQLIRDATIRREVAMAARARYRERQLRLGRDEEQRAERHAERTADSTSSDAVAAAIARAQARRAAVRNDPKK